MGTVEIIFSIQQHEALSCSQLSLLPLSRQNLRPMPTMDMEAMVDTVMAVMDTVDTVERDLLMPMPTMDMEVMEDMDVVMGMVVMDMVDTVASDLLKLKLNQKQKPSHGTDMDTPDTHTLMVDTDTHTLMLVLTSSARDLPNHPHTTVMDTDVVMDMAVTDTVDTVERDPLSHTTDMVDTEDTDMAVVMATDMAVNSYFQEAKPFYYLIFKIDV